MSKTSGTIASFHEMKCAVVARLSEGRSPEFRSHRHISPWNSNRVRFCEVFFWQHYSHYVIMIFAKEAKFPLSASPFFLIIHTCVFVAADAAFAPFGIGTHHAVDLLVAAVAPFVLFASAAGSLGRVLPDFFQ